jgi:lipoprotein-anchoring transpeptidase ErfK/SrfK
VSIERFARALCASYIFAGSAFGMYAGLQTHPDIGQQLREAATQGDNATFAKLFGAAQSGWETALRPESDIRRVAVGTPAPRVLPSEPEIRGSENEPNDAASKIVPEVQALQTQSFSVAPLDAPAPNVEADVQPPRAEPILPEPPAPAPPPVPKPAPFIPKPPKEQPKPDNNLPPDADIARVEERMHNAISDSLYRDFDLYLYVSKADRGPWAQHMYVFVKDEASQAASSLKLLHVWPVSTGRDAYEVFRGQHTDSFTPVGLFELDPDRMFVQYHSMHWDEEMPYSMFFNWVRNGDQTGVAIHSATRANVKDLGSRASAGCIQLSPKDARYLYNLVRANYRGMVPVFKTNPKTGTMSKDGEMALNKRGQVQRFEGYRVLVMIENYGGEDDAVVSSLY